MATFRVRTAAELLQELINRAVVRSDLSDLNDGSDLKQVLGAVAWMGEMILVNMARQLDLFDLDRLNGVDLDLRAEEYLPDGLARTAASRAAGTLRWTRQAGASAISIPVGTLVSRTATDGTRVLYSTTVAGTIPAGPAGTASQRLDGQPGDILARAEVLGTTGNAAVDEVRQGVTNIPGTLGVTNPLPFVGGVDAESDDDLRGRIRDRVRSLGGCTALALETRAKEADLDGHRVTVASAVQSPYRPGWVTVYVDDGTGFIAETANAPAEDLVTSATGGERRFYSQHRPWTSSTWTVTHTPALGAPVVLTRGTDYEVVAPWGLVELSEDSLPTGLGVGDRVVLGAYSYFTGLIREAQRLLDGDPTDEENYPARYVGAGVVAEVRAPEVVWVSVAVAIVVTSGTVRATAVASVRVALSAYVNGLSIGEDVVLAEIIQRAMDVAGVYDVAVAAPTVNIPIGDTQLARVSSANLVVE